MVKDIFSWFVWFVTSRLEHVDLRPGVTRVKVSNASASDLKPVNKSIKLQHVVLFKRDCFYVFDVDSNPTHESVRENNVLFFI